MYTKYSFSVGKYVLNSVIFRLAFNNKKMLSTKLRVIFFCRGNSSDKTSFFVSKTLLTKPEFCFWTGPKQNCDKTSHVKKTGDKTRQVTKPDTLKDGIVTTCDKTSQNADFGDKMGKK